jgi:hypothetical protein
LINGFVWPPMLLYNVQIWFILLFLSLNRGCKDFSNQTLVNTVALTFTKNLCNHLYSALCPFPIYTPESSTLLMAN